MAVQDREQHRENLIREILALGVVVVSIFLFFALVSYHAGDPSFNTSQHAGRVVNFGGKIGAYLADLALQLFGIGAYFLPVSGGYAALRLFLLEVRPIPWYRHAGALSLLLSFNATVAAKWQAITLWGEPVTEAGGAVGRIIYDLLAAWFNPGGTLVLLFLVLLISLILTLRISIVETLGDAGIGVLKGGGGVAALCAGIVQRLKSLRAPKPVSGGEEVDEAYYPAPSRANDPEYIEFAVTKRGGANRVLPAPGEAAGEDTRDFQVRTPELLTDDGSEDDSHLPDLEREKDELPDFTPVRIADPPPWEEIKPVVAAPAAASRAVEPPVVRADDEPDEPVRVVIPKAMKKKPEPVEEPPLSFLEPAEGDHPLPPLSLLEHDGEPPRPVDRDRLAANARHLEEKLKDFKVDGRVVEVKPGPVVTMYEFVPAPGVKVNKVVGLTDDLTMAMSALSIRIVAPIPGRGVVGIEIPNADRDTVYLKEIIESGEFQRSRGKLPLALGKDIFGQTVVSDLAKMPHLLVAGSTGSGKSVSVNTMILSLLYKAKPEDVRIIMVDPKMLELSIYEGIPHLLLPVVTDPKKAALALNWAVREMERRYKLMADKGVRNIDGYNAKIAREEAQKAARRATYQAPPPEEDGIEDAEIVDLDPVEMARSSLSDRDELEHGHLPYIVVIVDELADLMMVAGREIEEAIARLAQMARASGIHLILATQRPSVDVITGLIKANFPTRISFKVFSRIDSRTILDCMGAETLLGMGDMLFLPPGSGALQRVHGAFVSEDEVQKVVDFLKAQGTPEYDESILVAPSGGDGDGGMDDEYDEKWDEALALVADSGQASISMLQRRLKVGYNRAARMIEQMEREGIVGPSDGTSRPREVFINRIDG